VELDLFVDADGRGHWISVARRYSAGLVRVCSLLPSATEIVALLGLGDRLVGVSDECDWPPEVRGLPVVTASRVETAQLASAEIDTAVRAAVAEGRSLYAVDAELLNELAPDLVITQDLCAVCAVSSGDVLSLCEAETLSLNPGTLEEIARSVELVAERLGVPERGGAVARDMRNGIAETAKAVTGLPRRKIFVAEWLDPPFASGHWVPEMVAAAGGEEVLGRGGKPSCATTWDRVREAEPELIVLAPCGFDARRAAREAGRVELPAPAVAVDANAHYSRPSPRVVDGVRQLAHLLHPVAAPDPGLPLVDLRLRSVA
jgi:iron complex transport system substrate-binding protein